MNRLRLRCWSVAVCTAITATLVFAGIPGFDKELASDLITEDASTDRFLYHHELQVNFFVGAADFGRHRMLTHVPGMHGFMNEGGERRWWSDGVSYYIELHELVGLLEAEQPRVYALAQKNWEDWWEGGLAAGPPDRHTIEQLLKTRDHLRSLGVPEMSSESDSHGRVRPLDAFETAALVRLCQGHSLVREDSVNGVRGLGAIRAQQTCLKCHEDKKVGDLLGAFTYFGVKKMEPSEQQELRRGKLLDLIREGQSEAVLLKLVYEVGDYADTPPSDSEILSHKQAVLGIVTPKMWSKAMSDRDAQVVPFTDPVLLQMQRQVIEFNKKN